jgi:acyl dehydratase
VTAIGGHAAQSEFPLEAELRSYIGQPLRSFTHWCTPETIAKFARAIGADDPVHFDEAAAHARSFRTIVAPLSYYLAIRIGGPMVQALADLGVDGMPADEIELSSPHRAMAGETSVRFLGRIYAGDRVTLTRVLSGVTSKKGSSGILTMLTLSHVCRNQHNEVLLEEDYVRILL